MLAVPVFNIQGERTGEMEFDPVLFGGRVRPRLLKQAIVAFLDRQRRDSARTKSRSDVRGSTRKLYRQKGTGRARAGNRISSPRTAGRTLHRQMGRGGAGAGNLRTPIRRGGGRAFAKRGPRSTHELPKKMRRLARDSAILAKIEAAEVMVIEDLACAEPKTRLLAAILVRLGVDRGCLLALGERDRNVYLSGRNIPKTEVRVVDDLNAYEVLRRRKLIFTKPAFERLRELATGAVGGEVGE